MNKDKFLTLLMGGCWHEWNIVTLPPEDEEDPYYEDVYKCKICGREVNIERLLPAPKDHLSNPLPVIRWMEKEMPEVWEAYTLHVDVEVEAIPWKLIRYVHDLNNFITYLSEHREWGWKECPQVNCMSPECRENPECVGSGKIKHPALIYMEEE